MQKSLEMLKFPKFPLNTKINKITAITKITRLPKQDYWEVIKNTIEITVNDQILKNTQLTF